MHNNGQLYDGYSIHTKTNFNFIKRHRYYVTFSYQLRTITRYIKRLCTLSNCRNEPQWSGVQASNL